MKIEYARDKLNEARFFAEYLCNAVYPGKSQNPNTPGYYFSAFVNAAYSVYSYVETCLVERFMQQGDLKRDAEKRCHRTYIEPWENSLPEHDYAFWSEVTKFGGIRGKEVHVKPTETTVSEKSVPQLRESFVIRPPLVLFSGVDLGEEFKTGAFLIVHQHHVTIKDKQYELSDFAKTTVVILERFLQHFESSKV